MQASQQAFSSATKGYLLHMFEVSGAAPAPGGVEVASPRSSLNAALFIHSIADKITATSHAKSNASWANIHHSSSM